METARAAASLRTAMPTTLPGELILAAEIEDGVRTELRYTYDKAGNRLTAEKSGDTILKELTQNTYDEANRLLSSENSVTGKTTYTYDKNGNLTGKLAFGEEEVAYAYDVENRLKAVTEGGTLLMAALYDGDGNRLFTVERNTTKESYTLSAHEDLKATAHDDRRMGVPEGPVIPGYRKVFEKIYGFLFGEETEGTDGWYEETSGREEEGLPGKEIKESSAGAGNDLQSSVTGEWTTAKEEKNFFWYGFGIGAFESASPVPEYLAHWLHDAWGWRNVTASPEEPESGNARGQTFLLRRTTFW